MKQTYCKPMLLAEEAQAVSMIAVSIKDDNADPSKEVLTKENTDWDIWED